LEDQVTKLDSCLDGSRPHLSAMLTAITNTKAATAKAAAASVVVAKTESVAAAPVVAVPAVPKTATPAAVTTTAVAAVPAAVAPPAKLTPVSTLKGKVQITDILPDFVLIYWQDGTQPEKDIDVLVHPTGFDKKIYVLAPGGSIKLRSKDFSGHAISALSENTGVSQSLGALGSMQSRAVDVDWPDNSLMALRSDKSRVAESYVASISSATYTLLRFTGNSNSVSIDLKNPRGATKGYLLMPNYDPVPFDIGQGQDKSLTVSRNNISVGSVTLSGN
ncbi:MAG TPA: hypothetical protein VM553_05715, partial [Dongiaceae bacterium]|nr:hypothetical protein [Dongiaceae bacterium]